MDSLYRGTGGHNYIQETMTDFIKQQQEEAREKLMYARKLTATDSALYVNPYTTADDLDTLTAQIIKNTFTEALRIIDEHDPNKSMARKTSSAYWGNTLRKEIEQIINTITHPTQ